MYSVNYQDVTLLYFLIDKSVVNNLSFIGVEDNPISQYTEFRFLMRDGFIFRYYVFWEDDIAIADIATEFIKDWRTIYNV